MRATSDTIRLAGEDLRDHRHVCALVDGPDDLYALLMPFIVDGFEHGDRAFHMIDPELRDAHMTRLSENGIDVDAATASGQLEVLSWTDSYLREGTFDSENQFGFLRQSLKKGPGLGFPLTRLIGTTEWALESEVADALLVYEARIDRDLRTRQDVLVCAYDLNRHSARTIADALAVHPVAIVGGVMRTSREPARASARERLLAAAAQLFHENGIQATGVDSIIAAAGVAKATFYRHFPSKDDLVVAWLRDPRARWWDRVRVRAEADGTEPDVVIPRMFEAVGDWLEADAYRGCPYLNTATEVPDPTHPARVIVEAYLKEIEDYIVGAVTVAGYRNPRTLGVALHTLLAGSIALGVARRNSAQAPAARDAAAQLLKEAERD